MVAHIITSPSKSLGRAFRRCIALNLELPGYNQYKIPPLEILKRRNFVKFQLARVAVLRATCTAASKLALLAQTSRPKFLKFRLFFHLDHVWHRFDHTFRKERLGVRIHGVKLGL